MRILVTGGTGFIGVPLCNRLLSDGHELMVLSRKPERAVSLFIRPVECVDNIDTLDASEAFDAIINLAGEGIADKRWSKERKQALYNSRIGLTQQLIDFIAEAEHKPSTLISGSACGIYGDCGGSSVTEQTEGQEGFTHTLCHDWEQMALLAEKYGVRVCLIRTSVVLDTSGGALKKMLLPFKLGLGGHFGSGKQWMPWIHLEDEVEIIVFALNNTGISGPINAVAPEAVTNKQFTQALAKALGRPAILWTPAITLKVLLGEQSHLLLDSTCMHPDKLLTQGFEFSHVSLESALHGLS